MSLKAGRVGVAPDQVDVFGKIKSDATTGYTKQEADAKFETKSDATTSLAEKQPIQLNVPVKLLMGSALTVEDALQGLSNACIDAAESAVTDIVTGASVGDAGNHLIKVGKVVTLTLRLNSVTLTAWDADLCMIPEGYRPKYNLRALNLFTNSVQALQINSSGSVKSTSDLSNATVYLHATWITG